MTTDIVLNQRWPGGVMKQLGDAAGGVTYDQYAPGGPVRQLYTAAGVETPLDQYAPGGPIGQIEEVIEAGGAPDWVPAGALIHIDFVGGSPQGRAWTSTDGEVAISTLLGDNGNVNGPVGVTGYDPAHLLAGGYQCNNQDDFNKELGFLGVARTTLIASAGCTVRVQSLHEWLSGNPIYMMGASGSPILQFSYDNGDGTVAGNSSVVYDVDTAVILNATGLNALAVTMTPTRAEIAANGSAVKADPLNTDPEFPDWPLSGTQFVDVICHMTGALIQTFTIYEALPDTTGLSALSEVA